MSDLQYKDVALDFKIDDAGQFSAYVARFNNVDRTAEMIVPGAFKNLSDFISDGWVALNHDNSSLPLATIDSAKQDDSGLLVTGKFHSHEAAQATRAVVKERLDRGKAVKCSIGYKVLDSDQTKIQGKSVRRLKALDIFECSLVSLPANPSAAVISAKSLNQDGPKLLAIDDLKSLLSEFKAGKVVSQSNLNALRDMHAKMGDVHAALGAFLDQHDPAGSDPEPADDLEDGPLVGGGGRVVGKAARLKQLRLCVLRSRAKAASLHRE